MIILTREDTNYSHKETSSEEDYIIDMASNLISSLIMMFPDSEWDCNDALKCTAIMGWKDPKKIVEIARKWNETYDSSKQCASRVAEEITALVKEQNPDGKVDGPLIKDAEALVLSGHAYSLLDALTEALRAGSAEDEALTYIEARGTWPTFSRTLEANALAAIEKHPEDFVILEI